MKRKKTVYFIAGLMLVATVSGLFALKSNTEPVKGLIIFTQIASGKTDYNQNKGRIVAISPENKNPEILTNDFYAARSPEVSWDGRFMLFSGKKIKDEPWQIWKMNIGNRETEKVFDCKKDCIDPAILPDGHIVYSKRVDISHGLKGFALFTCAMNGTEQKQITFHPHDDVLASVMQDGRILFLSKELYPSEGVTQLIAVRPNGTKARLFYINPEKAIPISRGKEIKDDKMVFVESANRNNPGGSLVEISLHRPLHSRKMLSDDAAYLSAYPMESGKLVVSCKTKGSKTFGLYEFNPVTQKLGEQLYTDSNYWCVEPVAVYERTKPKKLPDDLLCSDMTGRILCLNANYSEFAPISDRASKGTIIEVMGTNGKWGEVPLEDDGSFFLRLPANKPFRFRTVNDAGEVVRGPSAWIWVRPHERRGCVGCHEDPEITPTNKRPIAISNLPVEIVAPEAKNTEKTNGKSEKTGK